MKIILSRKGFDSVNGGFPSPILPNGEMLSLPIPVDDADDVNLTYSDLQYGGQSYAEILQQLNSRKASGLSKCHLDPDIRNDIRIVNIPEWQPAFGQARAPEGELRNHGVGVGDLFLFFGLFQQTENTPEGTLHFHRGSPKLQVIYGYMQIGEIVRGQDISQRFPWHPHAVERSCNRANNTLYLPSKKLSFDGTCMNMPGYGTFSYSEHRVLTKPRLSPSRWLLLDWMPTVQISHHSLESIHDKYFQSAYIGQEFVIQENKQVTKWAASLFNNI